MTSTPPCRVSFELRASGHENTTAPSTTATTAQLTGTRVGATYGYATLPPELEITAWLEDGTIMGLLHRQYLIEGVQFHPESIASEHGHAMLKNFLDSARVPA